MQLPSFRLLSYNAHQVLGCYYIAVIEFKALSYNAAEKLDATSIVAAAILLSCTQAQSIQRPPSAKGKIGNFWFPAASSLLRFSALSVAHLALCPILLGPPRPHREVATDRAPRVTGRRPHQPISFHPRAGG